MTTAVDVLAAVRARLVARWPHSAVPIYWRGGGKALPDDAVAFLSAGLLFDRPPAGPAGFGGGRGGNLWRQTGSIEIVVATPFDQAGDQGLALAEDAAAIFRGCRFDGVDCGGGAVVDDDGRTTDGLYQLVRAVVDFSFDQIG